MKNPEENIPHEFMPEDVHRDASLNPDPKRDEANNWDEKAHMSRNLEKNIIQNERRNLNPDREKRQGSGLNPDRNEGDR